MNVAKDTKPNGVEVRDRVEALRQRLAYSLLELDPQDRNWFFLRAC
jgi:hypothetical protein